MTKIRIYLCILFVSIINVSFSQSETKKDTIILIINNKIHGKELYIPMLRKEYYKEYYEEYKVDNDTLIYNVYSSLKHPVTTFNNIPINMMPPLIKNKYYECLFIDKLSSKFKIIRLSVVFDSKKYLYYFEKKRKDNKYKLYKYIEIER